ncbi:RNase adapter RapZ [Candidatus Nitrosacidococcus tergens]|uniref:Uncharacterized protein n=1 Tax=Candidatus Nitrosacidococcus tergens TaxID=553981 RepID=A0A7G1QBK4_9GAMM|nr:RNase adapter RapZ [Candidatus Nitrosacidococcus tergens]CAB1277268.1 hypothetical protein; putative nucleoside triphosphate hydrolase domain [Candidatus Nitrosacidococcus tergens]
MKLQIISGVSGSGKSIVLHFLEDQGYYCVDNLPVDLLPHFVENMDWNNPHIHGAVSIDVRNFSHELAHLPHILEQIKKMGVKYSIIFLDADDATLLKRFSETRRKHPLSDIPLTKAIQHERNLLTVITQRADIKIDTTNTNIYQLQHLINIYIANDRTTEMSLLFQSFGYKHGVPLDADFMFDVRCLPNPYWEPHLRSLTGQDKSVISYLENHKTVLQMKEHLIYFLQQWLVEFKKTNRSYLTVSIGCTGGQHRSVYLVEQLKIHFQPIHSHVICYHRDLI